MLFSTEQLAISGDSPKDKRTRKLVERIREAANLAMPDGAFVDSLSSKIGIPISLLGVPETEIDVLRESIHSPNNTLIRTALGFSPDRVNLDSPRKILTIFAPIATFRDAFANTFKSIPSTPLRELALSA